MPQKSIKKNIIYQLLYRVLTILTPIITSPYLSRVLGPEKLGIFSNSYAFVCYFILLAMLGIETYGTREVAICQNNHKTLGKIFEEIYCIQIIMSIISLALYIICIVYFQKSINICIKGLQGLYILAALLDINWFYFGCEEFKITVGRNIIVKTINIVLILIFIKTPDDLPLYILIMAGCLCINNLVLWFFLKNFIKFQKITLKDTVKHFPSIISLFFPIMAMSIFHIMDKSMLGTLSDMLNSGYYYNVDRLVAIPYGFLAALSTVMLPRLTRDFKNGEMDKVINNLNRSFELNCFLVSAIAFGIGSIANEFIPVFFGSNYSPCIQLLICFIPILIIKSFGEFIRQQILIPNKKDKLYTIALIIGAIANVITNYILIPYYGALGAVFGTLVAETVVFIIEVFGVIKEINLFRMIVSYFYYFIIGIIMFIFIRIIARYLPFDLLCNVLLEICVGVALYIIGSIGYWIIHKNSVFYKYIKKYFYY